MPSRHPVRRLIVVFTIAVGISATALSIRHRLVLGVQLLRIALHPHGLDHPATVSSIARTLDAARRDRALAYDERLFKA